MELGEHKNFMQGDLVMVDGGIIDRNGPPRKGKILGIASRTIIDCYIVDVGEKISEEYPFTAIAVSEFQLNKI